MIAVLSESHASFHTFPETGDIFVGLFTCGHCDPEAIFKRYRGAA
jgi:S-adenosylmethionine/arginine decarboxylase-like enzyme